MAVETGATSLKQMLQGMTGGEVTVIQGRVVSASPLRVQAVNDEKLTVFQNSLFVPRHLTDHPAEITFDRPAGGEGGIAGRWAVTVHNALKAGETVHLLSLNHGKQYYVLDRA